MYVVIIALPKHLMVAYDFCTALYVIIIFLHNQKHFLIEF